MKYHHVSVLSLVVLEAHLHLYVEIVTSSALRFWHDIEQLTLVTPVNEIREAEFDVMVLG